MSNKNNQIKKLLPKVIIVFSFIWLSLQLLFFALTISERFDLVYQNSYIGFIYTPFTDPRLSVEEIDGIFQRVFPLLFYISLLSALVGSLIISKGRSFVEAVCMFIAFAIPRRRKLSGRVFDINTGLNIPFTNVKVVQKSENGEKKIIVSAITDFDGRYRMNVNKGDYYVEVNQKDYKPYKKKLTNVYKNNVIQDIPLENNVTITNKIKSIYFYYLKPKLYIYFTYYLYAISILIFLSSLAALRSFGISVFTLTYVLVYAVSVTWNTRVLMQRVRFGAGRILDFNSKKPIMSASVKILKDDNQVQVVYSNRQGVVRINLDEGLYKVSVMKSGHEMVNEVGQAQNFEELFLSKDGFLPKDLFLKPTDKVNSVIEGLDNPFT